MMKFDSANIYDVQCYSLFEDFQTKKQIFFLKL